MYRSHGKFFDSALVRQGDGFPLMGYDFIIYVANKNIDFLRKVLIC